MQHFLVTGTMRSGTTLMADLLCSTHTLTQRHPHLLLSNEGFGPFRKTFRTIERQADLCFPDARLEMVEYPLTIDALGEVNSPGDLMSKLLISLNDKLLNRHSADPDLIEMTGIKYTNAFFYLDAIWDIIPDFRTIIMVRDPRDVYISHKLRKGGEKGDKSNLSILNDLLLLQRFLRQNGNNDRVQIVRYETLTSSYRTVVEQSLRFLGLSPDEYDWSSVEGGGVIRNSSTNENGPAGAVLKGVQVAPPNEYDAAEYCTNDELKFIEGLLEELMLEQSYEISSRLGGWSEWSGKDDLLAQLARRRGADKYLREALAQVE